MKILLIGIFAFFAWAAFSVNIYVCKIKGLCEDPVKIVPAVMAINKVPHADTLGKTSVNSQPAIPESLITYFGFDKSDFNSDPRSAKFFDESKAYIDKNPMSEISITGYADSIGTEKYNLDLGFRRAKSIQTYFENKGFPSSKIIADSKGEKEPAESNNTPGGRANNRRAVITIKIQSHE